jgi:hypothetical protein
LIPVFGTTMDLYNYALYFEKLLNLYVSKFAVLFLAGKFFNQLKFFVNNFSAIQCEVRLVGNLKLLAALFLSGDRG